MTDNFHDGGARSWVSGGETLEAIRRLVTPGMQTLETGAGASTVAFAQAGARHTAISPSSDEHARIAIELQRQGLDSASVRFFAESSDAVLPRLVADGEHLDFALIDGKHAFPMPIVDFHYIDRMMKVGGALIVDDMHIRAVRMLGQFLETSPQWVRAGEPMDARGLLYRKNGEASVEDDWETQPLNRWYPSFWFLPAGQRTRLTARAAGSNLKRRLVRSKTTS